MEKVKLLNLKGETVKQVELNENLLVDKIAKQAMFDAGIAENAGNRQGTHSTLTKGEVRGGGKKPFAQKHTGNARQGSIRNPQWVGGGVVFGPKPGRNYTKKVNAKVSKLAFKSAITLKVKDASLCLLEDAAKLTKPSTKTIVEMLEKCDFANKKVLFVLNDSTDNVTKSIRNIEKACVKAYNQVSTKDIMHANVVIIQESACEKLGKANA